MRSVGVALLFVFACAVAIAATGASDPHGVAAPDDEAPVSSPHVQSLTNLTFDEFVSGSAQSMVKFYAPWCGHCKKLAPHFIAAAAQLKDEAKFGEVDCTVFAQLCQRFEVTGYPVVKYFKGDPSKHRTYEKARETAAIVSFVRRQKLPEYSTVSSRAELSRLVEEKKFVLTLFTGEQEKQHSQAFSAFSAVSFELFNDYDFALCSDAKVAKEFGIVQHVLPALVALRTFDEKKVVFKGDFNEHEIKQFVVTYSFPLLGRMSPDEYPRYEQRGLPIVWLFVESGKSQNILEAGRLVSKSYLGKLSIVQVDGTLFEQYGKAMGVASTTPGIAITHKEGRFPYTFDAKKKFTSSALRKFIDDFLAGKLLPYSPPRAPPPPAAQAQQAGADHVQQAINKAAAAAGGRKMKRVEL